MSNITKSILPEYGYIKKIAEEVGCTPLTVRKALRYGAKGAKAEKCRQLYYKWYRYGDDVLRTRNKLESN